MPNIAGAIISIALQAAFALGVVLLFVFLWRRRSRPREPACGVCGYAVHGLPTFECPECGSDLRKAGIVTTGPLAPVLAWQVALLWLLLAPGFAWVLAQPLHRIAIPMERFAVQESCTVENSSLRLVRTIGVTRTRPPGYSPGERPVASGHWRIHVVRHGQIESGTAEIADEALLRDDPPARARLQALIRSAILEIPVERGDEREPPSPQAADADAGQIAAALRAAASSDNLQVIARAVPGGMATFNVTPGGFVNRQFRPFAHPVGFYVVLGLSALIVWWVRRAATRRRLALRQSAAPRTNVPS
jgi:hypothetical protein